MFWTTPTAARRAQQMHDKVTCLSEQEPPFGVLRHSDSHPCWIGSISPAALTLCFLSSEGFERCCRKCFLKIKTQNEE